MVLVISQLLFMYSEDVPLLRRVVCFSISEHLPFRIAMQGMIKGVKDSYFWTVFCNCLIINK